MTHDARSAVQHPSQYALDAALARVAALEDGLRRSVELQSHYATLLNDYDGGKRLTFASADDWLARLALLANQTPIGDTVKSESMRGPNRDSPRNATETVGPMFDSVAEARADAKRTPLYDEIAAILSPAIDVRTPYAKQMILALTMLIGFQAANQTTAKP